MKRRAMVLAASLAVALVGSALSAGAATAKANPVVNGSFERPVLNDGEMLRFVEVGQHVGVWTVSVGTVILEGPFPGAEIPPDGNQDVVLRTGPGPSSGEICQTVSGLIPSTSYKIRFLAASILSDSTIDITFGGNSVAHLDLSFTSPAVFVAYHSTVTAAASSASLCLRGGSIDGNGFPIVDAVHMKPVAG